jgi:Zn-dependent M28 family amino/carboxypeptidase
MSVQRLLSVAGLAALVAAASIAEPPNRLAFPTAAFDAHLRFLADDLLEGRAIGSRGGRLAASYVEAIFRAAGLEPGYPDGFRQPVAMNAFAPDPRASLAYRVAGTDVALAPGDDFIANNLGLQEGRLGARPLFVGYAIDAPREGWNDFNDVAVAGRLLIALVNEPGRDDPARFRGRALTAHGRWRTKLEEAARRGAAGMLLVHTDADAGYTWEVVRNSWSGASFVLADEPHVLPLAGWLREERARALLAAAGLDLDDLRRRAERPDFVPVEVPLEVRVSAARSVRPVEGANVVGVLPGRSPMAVLLSAHYDHFGIAREVGGDAIYNGAVDNGTALATLLALAQAYGRVPRESRPTLVFAAVDAEEEGMLGSTAYTRRPAVPLPNTLAAINFEMSNAWGRTRDVIAIGAQHSSLGELLGAVLARSGLRLAPEPVPEQGYFFRSDQYAFAQAGVPAIWLDGGTDYEGRPAGWGEAVRKAYRDNDYHRPSDEVKPEFDLSGLAQLAELTSALIAEIAARGRVDWLPASEFQSPWLR